MDIFFCLLMVIVSFAERTLWAGGNIKSLLLSIIIFLLLLFDVELSGIRDFKSLKKE